MVGSGSGSQWVRVENGLYWVDLSVVTCFSNFFLLIISGFNMITKITVV